MEAEVISINGIERALFLEPHVTGFFIEDWPIPAVDLSLWFIRGRNASRRYLSSLANYLNSGYVEDDFTDHEERREWRSQMQKKYPEFHDFYSRNPLRNNRINIAVESARMLNRDYVGTDKGGVLTLSEQIAGFKTGEDYHQLPLEDKKSHVFGLKMSIFYFLGFLSEQRSLLQ
jgi:hypothetical protein